MRDDALINYAYRVQDRHGPDGRLMRTMRSLSALAAQAREIHKERGPQVAASVIKGELAPKFAHHVRELQDGLASCQDLKLRDDYGQGYGLSLNYKRDLSALGRLSPTDWGLIEMDAKTGTAA